MFFYFILLLKELYVMIYLRDELEHFYNGVVVEIPIGDGVLLLV